MSLLIPAGWESLGAGGPEGNQEARPASSSLKIDGAVEANRQAGERVRVALAAHSDKPGHAEKGSYPLLTTPGFGY